MVGNLAADVDVIDHYARNTDLTIGFRPLLDDPRHLVRPMHEIRKLKLDPI